MKHRNSLSDRHNLKVTSTQSHSVPYFWRHICSNGNNIFYLQPADPHPGPSAAGFTTSFSILVYFSEYFLCPPGTRRMFQKLQKKICIDCSLWYRTRKVAEILSTYTEVFHCPQLFLGNLQQKQVKGWEQKNPSFFEHLSTSCSSFSRTGRLVGVKHVMAGLTLL